MIKLYSKINCGLGPTGWIAAFDASLVRLLSKLSGNVKLVEISGNFRYLPPKRAGQPIF